MSASIPIGGLYAGRDARSVRTGHTAKPLRARGGFGSRSVEYLLMFLLLFESSSMIFHFVRVAVYDQIGHIAKVYTITAIVFSLVVWPRSRLRFAPINALFLIALAQGFIMMLVNGHSIAKPCVGHFYYWLIMFIGFNTGYNAQINVDKVLKYLTVFAHYALAISVVGYLMIEVYRSSSGASLWMGYAGGQLILPSGVYFVQKRWKLFGLCTTMILLSGRRGPLAAAVLTILFIYALWQLRRFWLAACVSLVPVVILSWGLFLVSENIVNDTYRSEEDIAYRLALKWHSTFAYQENVTAATSGRNLEVNTALEHLWVTVPDVLVGQGFGWYVDIDGYLTHFLHLNYMNFLLTHGVVIGGLLILFIIRHVKRFHSSIESLRLSGPERELQWIFLYYLISSLLVSFTVSLLSISFLFWLLFGVTGQTIVRSRTQRRRLHLPSEH